MKRIALIIPCFNEAAVIGSSLVTLARELAAASYAEWEIVCVDDGSSDSTAEIVSSVASVCDSQNVHVQLVSLSQNLGKGAAIQHGLRAVQADIYGYMDADLSINYQSVLGEIVSLLDSCDMVIGRRMQKRASGYTMFRTLASSVFSWFAYRVFKLPAHDVQCGFKFFTHAVKPVALAVSQPKFSFDLEFLSRAQTARHSIQEISVTWQHKQSSSVTIGDGVRYILDAIRVLMRYS